MRKFFVSFRQMSVKLYTLDTPAGEIWVAKHPQFGRAEFTTEYEARVFLRTGEKPKKGQTYK